MEFLQYNLQLGTIRQQKNITQNKKIININCLKHNRKHKQIVCTRD